MPDPAGILTDRCLYTLIEAPRTHHERIVAEVVSPVTDTFRNAPELESLFFVRTSEPTWQVRFRVLGAAEWVQGPVRAAVLDALRPLEREGIVERHSFAVYDRELERYGGEEGMRLAEQLFRHDSLACLDLMGAERRGEVRKSRREVSLLLVDRLLDAFAFDRNERLAFYRHGYQWAIDMGTWGEDEFRILDERYRGISAGLARLFGADPALDEAARWGGEEPARIGGRFLSDVRPVAEAIRAAYAAGRVRRDLVDLVWSYAHMLTNRLGIDPAPEAFLRYFMHRFLTESAPGVPSVS